MLIVLGIASLKFIIGIVPIVLGVLAILSSFETLIVIQSAAGSGASAQIIKADKNKAREFVNNVNNTLAER